jgi:hypothetical protein
MCAQKLFLTLMPLLNRLISRLRNNQGTTIIEMVIVVMMITIISSAVLGVAVSLITSMQDSRQRLTQIESTLNVTGSVTSAASTTPASKFGYRPAGAATVPGIGTTTAGRIMTSSLAGDQLVIDAPSGCQRYMFIERLKQIWVATTPNLSCTYSPQPFFSGNGSSLQQAIRGPNVTIAGNSPAAPLLPSNAYFDKALDSITENSPAQFKLDNEIRLRRLASNVFLYDGDEPIFHFFESNGTEISNVLDQAAITATPAGTPGVYQTYETPPNQLVAPVGFDSRLSYIRMIFEVNSSANGSGTSKLVNDDVNVGQICSTVISA